MEARVLTLDEIFAVDILWYESRNGHTSEWGRVTDGYGPSTVQIKRLGISQTYEDDREYGATWRCWNWKPSKEQRKATAWREI